MTRRTVTILVVAFLLLLAVLQISGLLIRIDHYRYACFSIEQSKEDQLFVRELEVPIPAFETAWIEKQCDYYWVSLLGITITSGKSPRNDYVLVDQLENSRNSQNWPRYNNEKFLINFNAACVVTRFKTLEEFDPSKITFGPVK